MKSGWIIGRVSLVLFFVIGFVVTLGCENPLASLSALLSNHTRSATRVVASNLMVGASNNHEVSTAQEEDESNEPVEPAEDLVKDWAQPEVTLFVTGRLNGYIEPCGCTGLTNQKGGLLRRRACQNVLLGRGWNPIMIDAGNQIHRIGQQPEIKLATAYEILCKTMKYDVVGLGVEDLKASAVSLYSVIENAKQEFSPVTSANVLVFEDDSITNKFRIVERNGKRIGVTTVVGKEHVDKFQGNGEYSVTSTPEAIAAVVANPQFAACDFKVLMVQSEVENCRELAKQFPNFNLLVTSGGAGDPTMMPEEIKVGNHMTSMIQVGVKGMYVGLVGIDFAGAAPTIKYQRVPLDARFKDPDEIKKIFLAYQNELKTLWQNGLLDDIKPRLHPSGHKFVGSAVCEDCHDVEYDIWLDGIQGNGGPHARATADLTDPGERTWVKRNFDPECVSCHATGWNPQEYFPYETGFIDLEKDEALHGNGCENCHGPASAHVEAENRAAAPEELLEKLRKELHVTKEDAKARICYSCHDLDNSPDYAEAPLEEAWAKYWPAVEHGDGE
jgi:hypothetical protein